MTDTKNPNKPLFSQHYLKYRLQECLEWQLDINSDFEKLNKLYLSKKAILPTLNEAQTEDVFIKPVLEILGFKNIPQVVTRGKGRAERPDYALFANEEERDTAYTLQNNETAFYERVLVIAEAKYWERPLSKVSANDKRDIFKNENPSFQISSYLTGTNVDWGILTNGREWRLYYRQASSTATEFYPIDLVESLESADIEKFKYFWLFFRSAAFEKDNYNKNFLERVREGSTTYATQVGNELKKLVFEQIFPDLAGGFVADAMRRGKTVESKQVYAATLSFLYKLLFLLYAEARNLLPITAAYRDYSLIKITQEIAESVDKEKTWSQSSTNKYTYLLSLFGIVDIGGAELDVPSYNGGLFHFNFHKEEDKKDYPDNYFLSQHHLSDAVLVPALDKLARFEKLPIDYGFLGVRQLGSIYEGLLEYRVVIEDGNTGKVHLENDKGERKATGSYYTPDYIVKYIVSHTLKPILKERKLKIKALMKHIIELKKKIKDGDKTLQKDLEELEIKSINILLDIKICDPAMGSGHFLVGTVDYLTDELIIILNEYPEHNPVLDMLEKTRESILANLQQQGITIDVNKLGDTQLLQRVVMKRCIYGVDLNPMAVELAKVSLWLNFFTIGAPLSFLDHHLRCGNSLIGTTVREANAKMQQEESGQRNFFDSPFAGFLDAARKMRDVSMLNDATSSDVETSKKLFKEFYEDAKDYKPLLDIYVSQFFDVKQAKNWLERFGTNAISVNVQSMKDADKVVYEDAKKLFEEKRFFHWDLEFPEVFIDLEKVDWKENPGFDAVIGNPPYDELSQDSLGRIIDEKSFIDNTDLYKEARTGRVNLYRLFIALAIDKTKQTGNHGFIVPMSLLGDKFTFQLRKKILLENTFLNVEAFPQKDNPKERVFFDAKLPTCLYVLTKQKINKSISVKTHPGKDILENSPHYKTSAAEIAEFDFDNFTIPSVSAEEWNIAKKIATNPNICKLGNVATPMSGEIVFNESFKPYLTENPEHTLVLRGGHVQRYELIDDPKQGTPIYINKQLWLSKSRGGIAALSHQQSRIIYQESAALDNWRRIIATKLPAGNVCGHKICYFVNIQYDDLAFLAIFNSNFIEWRFKLISVTNSLSAYQITSLPFPIFEFTTESNLRQNYFQEIINSYHELIEDSSHQNKLIEQIQLHLEKQPSEADVIHDFLAYLAEQMIELNKQKQTEAKGFLTWLERLIGTEIDNLTNKSKIQNYLGDYYKQNQADNHLTLDELIGILKKNQKKLKIYPTARKEQETLAKEYQSSLNKLLPIKKQLKQCDWLIDEIVYRLYGLTEEEKAIIQG
ncbi:MAG: restriction endonuclease [Anabaena sp. LE011-02]|nr:MAG: restriction endonuclease [Anabaena sp. LE011-02]